MLGQIASQVNPRDPRRRRDGCADDGTREPRRVGDFTFAHSCGNPSKLFRTERNDALPPNE